MTRPAIAANATFDGVHLSVPADSWRIRNRPGWSNVALSDDGRRSFHRWNGSGLPLKSMKYDFGIEWEHLGTSREPLEELLSIPGEHDLVLYREEQHCWPGNGSRVEFTMPRPLAVDLVDPLPPGLGALLVQPRVKVTRTGPWLTYVPKATEEYEDAETADADEVWFLVGGNTFKLPAGPAAGELIFARVVPVYRVIEAAEPTEKRLQAPIPEPMSLLLEEA